MPKKVAKMYNWILEHRRSPRLSAMKASKSEHAKEIAAVPVPHLQVYSRDSKRQKLTTAPDTAAKLVQKSEGDPHEYHPCNVEQLTSMPSTSCMPDKRILELILDMLQRRDTHEIFAQPVDANEVEGYYEIIKEPMDFGTMRAKLHEGMYSSLEQFETDVFLISRNAMQFNSSSTIYFRQARAIHELAKRVFHTLKTDPESFRSKISQTRRRKSRKTMSGARGSLSSPASKPKSSSIDSTSVWPDDYKDDKACHPACANLSGIYNCEVFGADRHRENNSNTEAERRSTYGRQGSFSNESKTAVSATSNGSKQLIPVDLTDIGYKESLMLFTRSLGPTAQRIAAHKLQFASSFILTRPYTADATPFEAASSDLSYPFHLLGNATICLAGNAPISDANNTLCNKEQVHSSTSIKALRDETCLNRVSHSGFRSSSLFSRIPKFSDVAGFGNAASTSTRTILDEKKSDGDGDDWAKASLSKSSRSDLSSSFSPLLSGHTFHLPYLRTRLHQSNFLEHERYQTQCSASDHHILKRDGLDSLRPAYASKETNTTANLKSIL